MTKPKHQTKRHSNLKSTLVAALVIAGVALLVICIKTPEQQQRECERVCAPLAGHWMESPDWPKASPGKKAPMVCLCKQQNIPSQQ